MENENIDPKTGQPVIEVKTEVIPPVVDPPEPIEPSLGEIVPKIEYKTKDDEGNDLSDEEKNTNYQRAVTEASLESSTKSRVAGELVSYLNAHPEYATYADQIKKFVNHPNRFGMIKNGLPIETVIIEAIGVKNLMRIGAEIAGKSKVEADLTLNGGQPAGGKATETTSVAKMDFKDFHQLQELAKSGQLKAETK